MLRFEPDTWLEWLLRPFLMVDPSTYVYFEAPAPDWRFAALLIFLGVGLLARRVPQRLQAGQGRMLLALLVMLYVWTYVVGNGRYFVVGLLLVGPLLVLATRLLPGSRSIRVTALAGVMVVQALAIGQAYVPGRWGLAKWGQGPGLPIEDSPLRHTPAVFLSIGGLSFSLLVPKFHPQSRWANITGQSNITPALPEYPRLVRMLDSGLPIYVMLPENVNFMASDLQPNLQLRNLLAVTLAPHGLVLKAQPCISLQSTLKPQGVKKAAAIHRQEGFWFCAAEKGSPPPAPKTDDSAAPADLDDIMAAVERRCPRFFPPGGGNTTRADSYTMRNYPGTDVLLYVEDRGRVLYKHHRALNPSTIGTLDEVRRGEFQLACDKLPGRYQLPWNRE